MTRTSLSAALKLFSLSLSPATIDLAGQVCDGSLRKAIASTWRSLELAEGQLSAFERQLALYEGRDPEDVLHELRREQTRLFLGKNPPVANSEGVWRKKAEGKIEVAFMINSYSVEVADFMRSCGIVRAAGYNDCIDYVENELDFAAFLANVPQELVDAGVDVASLFDEFADKHLKLWIPGFCDDVAAQSRAVYYTAVCELLKRLVIEL